jgi:nuclear transport factor 2 (NTF2) superfamily protein
MTEQRPPLPPFTRDSAIQKVRAAEDGWNSRDAEKVALAYTVDSEWRNRSEFVHGRGKLSSSCSENGAKSSNTG